MDITCERLGNEISCYYQNVRGLRTKTNNFYKSLSLYNFDIILLTETWLSSDIANSELFDDRYSVYRKDRDSFTSDKKKGGGVLVAVHKRAASRILLHEFDDLEHIIVKVNEGSLSLLISVVYFPPGSDLASYERFGEDIENLMDKYDALDVLCCGDFNLPGMIWDNSESNYV